MKNTPEKIDITGKMIRLGQLLKMANLVENGGEAKARIQNGEVLINGEVDTRRGRQLSEGDVIEIAGQQLQVHYTGEDPGD